MQSASFVLHNDTLCEISGALTNSLMTANLFSLAAIAAQFDAINRQEEKLLLRLSSGDQDGDGPQPAFTFCRVMLINLGGWFYVLVAASPLLASPAYGPHVIGVCGVLATTPGVLYACHVVLVLSAIVTSSAIIALYYHRLRNSVVYGVSRRASDMSECVDLAAPTANDTENVLRFVRVSFLSLIGSRAGWFVVEILFRTVHNAFPLYIVRLFYMLTPLASLVNPWMVLLSVDQYCRGVRGEAIPSGDRCATLLEHADALKRFPRFDTNRLHPNSFENDWRVQARHTVTRHYFEPSRPLDVHRNSFSQGEQFAAHYFRPISAPIKRDTS
uniref:Uncharacterized protein n=1 Tax=Plectus sambesii TaxID=2011161 RepID=A0A914V3T7_9BILA